ncbi:uncharacterized protein LOC126372128 isoform X2 [Pectinophora gossypiella]|uniref:uncharacterized protein LOC126372128 isoform X2 n=1 Tax=Pectinophora gossypiella TaxID=13191 RepID=UPI00214E9572|nr:uncharacterized protein LOC126372128 isoform X2 [Pectinophora gossypiella]
MNMDRDVSTTDEYLVTALQIFDYCGADNGGTLRVDALMEKFAPFVKTNKAEYSYLKSLLDPEQNNPEIDVTQLARALTKYSESQKSKADLDESFSLNSGPMPQDSDSGISTDGYQLLEDLQCELREKAHLAQQLRGQMEFRDRQHEEALATLSAERDSLRSHLNMLREENITLTHVRQNYEEACDRLCCSEEALGEARRELESCRKKNRGLTEQVSSLENERLTLQELLTKSKAECHRINEMYASRQAALREDNETLRTEHADLTMRLQDQEQFMQQIIKEKVLLEMELKDMLNKSNHTQSRLDRSIDVSYTEDQMLTALDTLNSDTRFVPENRLLDEESFISALKEDQGRSTNMSLFDEIRLSISNMSRQSFIDSDDTQCDKCTNNLNNSLVTTATQTDEGFSDNDVPDSAKFTTDDDIDDKPAKIHFRKKIRELNLVSIQTQTDFQSSYDNNNCSEKLSRYTIKLESELRRSNCNIKEMQVELDRYEQNLILLQNVTDEGNDRNKLLQTIVNSLQSKIGLLEAACTDQKERINSLSADTCYAACQTDSDQASVSTQAEMSCAECEKRRQAVPQRSLRKYLWEPLKCLFQVFAVVSFLCAVSVLYGVSRRSQARCERDPAPVPWRWLDAQEFMDLLLRIEYVADVPM